LRSRNSRRFTLGYFRGIPLGFLVTLPRYTSKAVPFFVGGRCFHTAPSGNR
jgi:hypothetical protein